MKKTVTLGLFILFATTFLAAQDYKGRARIKGFVYDKEGNPIEGVTVKLFSVKAQDGFEVETDKQGKWVAAWIRGGKWNIDFQKVGYTPKKISVNVKTYGDNPVIEVNIEKVEGLVLTEDP
ncbi:carboxypeptidase regulatory-like domain-containing protein, partial [bacterium]|nr:carboxypeptidase regulatory-like domain-containing protein [bacterium]